MMKRKVIYIAAGLLLAVSSSSALAEEITVPLSWWSSKSGRENVREISAGNEGVRLWDAYDGWIEGSIGFPEDGTWLLDFAVSSDVECGQAHYVDVFFNHSLLKRYYNTGAYYPTEHVVSGDSFHYRFEFANGCGVYWRHMMIRPGTATLVPEPSTILALLCGLGGLAWRKRK